MKIVTLRLLTLFVPLYSRFGCEADEASAGGIIRTTRTREISEIQSKHTGKQNYESVEEENKKTAGLSGMSAKRKAESGSPAMKVSKVKPTAYQSSTRGSTARKLKDKLSSRPSKDNWELPNPKWHSKGKGSGDTKTETPSDEYEYEYDYDYDNEYGSDTSKGKREKSKKSKSKSKSKSKEKRSSKTITTMPSPHPTVLPAGPSSGNTIRQLTPYGLEYTVTEDRVPFRSEFLEVVEVTRTYLDGFFMNSYEETEGGQIEDFLTVFIGSSFDFGRPILISFESSAVFQASTSTIPNVSALDRTLSSALRGENLNGFIGMLQSLPRQNVFSTTIFVNKTVPGTVSVSFEATTAQRPEETSVPRLLARAAAGTATIAMVLAVVVVFTRRQVSQDAKNIEFEIKNITVNCEENTVATSSSSQESLSPPEENADKIGHEETRNHRPWPTWGTVRR